MANSRIVKKFLWIWALPLLIAGACKPDIDIDPQTPLSIPSASLTLDEGTGRVELRRPDRSLIATGLTAWAMLDSTEPGVGKLVRIGSRRAPVLNTRTGGGFEGLGRAQTIELSGAAPDGIELTWTWTAYPERDCFAVRLSVTNRSTATVRLAKTVPYAVDASLGGAAFLGDHPAQMRILENGSFGLLDHVAGLEPGDLLPPEGFGLAAPGNFPGHSVSNWNHAVGDVESKRGWVAGGLTFERALPLFNTSYNPQVAEVSDEGRTGFTYLSAEMAYLPELKPIPPGESVSSEWIYIAPNDPDVIAGTERYARAVKDAQGIELWTERHPDNRIPNGWNSWSGSGSTGGLGTNIDEQVILANLDVMATELRDWGMDWFQIDDGYEPAYGDWTWRADRFPNGPAWLAQQIRDRGLKPGLWMAPFTWDEHSQAFADHPDWTAGPGTLSGVIGGGYEILDFTNPEVIAYLDELMRRVHEDWGYDWLKLDFGYHALFGGDFHDPTMTREEAWRRGVGTVRDALGDDVFLLMVAVMGLNWGLVDGDRTTLDNMPVWDHEPGQNDPLFQQGFKPTVRTNSRRWFMHQRVWVNHPDLIFFRSNTRDPTWPRITMDESLAFNAWVGLSGGIVKLGEPLTELAPEHINAVRELLPIHPDGARPIDLLEREFPERWHKHIPEGLDGYAEPYDLVGLFHWGSNTDMSVNPFLPIPDDGAPREHRISLDEIGMTEPAYLAYEFREQAFLGEISDELVVSVPSHSARVTALRPKRDRPQFLGWNRQITMGGVLLRNESWDPPSRTLTLDFDVATAGAGAPFTWQVAVHVPSAFTLDAVTPSGAPLSDLTVTEDGPVVRIVFSADDNGPLQLQLAFL